MGWKPIALVSLAVAVALGVWVAQSAWFGARPGGQAADAILARRVLMAEINRNMDEILTMMDEGQTFEPRHAFELSYAISAMMLAVPHLFKPGTDIWSEKLQADDPARVSLALPSVWREFPDFYARAQAAAELALATSRSESEADFRNRALALQRACDDCHAKFRRPDEGGEIPIPKS